MYVCMYVWMYVCMYVCITTQAIQEFNKFTAESFAVRLKQTSLTNKNDAAGFVKKTGDFDEKLININKKLPHTFRSCKKN